MTYNILYIINATSSNNDYEMLNLCDKAHIIVIMRVEFIIFKVCLVVLNRMGTSSNIALEHNGSLEVSASCLSLDLGAPTLRSRWINLNIFRM